MLNILKEDNNVLAEHFKMSNHWVSAFMKRYKLAWRRRTRISQKLPAQIKKLLERFCQFIKQV